MSAISGDSDRSRIRGTVLVADDSAEDRSLARTALLAAAPNLDIHEVADGVEVLAYLRDASRPRPDLLLLDLKMPRMDGLEVLVTIHGEARFEDVPVIVMFSTASDARFVGAAYRAGANAFVAKPSSVAELRHLMQALVDHWFRIVELPPH